MTQMIHKQLIYIWGKLTGRQPSTIINYEELTDLFYGVGGKYLPLALLLSMYLTSGLHNCNALQYSTFNRGQNGL